MSGVVDYLPRADFSSSREAASSTRRPCPTPRVWRPYPADSIAAMCKPAIGPFR
jgi:hypothetical protein